MTPSDLTQKVSPEASRISDLPAAPDALAGLTVSPQIQAETEREVAADAKIVAPTVTPEEQAAIDRELIAEAGKHIVVPHKSHCTSNRKELFHEPTVSALVRLYQTYTAIDPATGKTAVKPEHADKATAAMKLIVLESLPLIDTTILKHKFTKLDELEALRAECVMKVMRIAAKHDANRGACFSYFSFALKRFLISLSKKIISKSSKITLVDDESLESMEGTVYISPDISEEFLESLDDLEVRNLGEAANEILRYYLDFLVADGLRTPRAKLAASAVQIFGATPDHAGFLFDFLMVRLRMHLLDRNPEPFKDLDVMRLTKRFTTLPELAELIGPATFAKMVKVFGGQTINMPTDKELTKMRNHKAWLNEDSDDVPSNYRELQSNYLDGACDAQRLNPKGFSLNGHRRGHKVCGDELVESDITGGGAEAYIDHIADASKGIKAPRKK